MSNINVKGLIIFLSGSVFGGSIATFVTHRWARKKYLAISDERVKSLEEYIDKLQADKLSLELRYNVISDSEDVDGSVSGSNSSEGDKSANGKRISRGNDVAYTDYTKYSKITQSSGSGYEASVSKADELYEKIAAELEHPMDSDEDEDYISEGEVEKQRQDRLSEVWTNKANSNAAPEVIPYEKYGEGGYFDEVTLYFYAGDKVLTTEGSLDGGEEVIPDPETYVGTTLEDSGFSTNSEQVIYVRNYRRASDYEISKIFDKYSERDIY